MTFRSLLPETVAVAESGSYEGFHAAWPEEKELIANAVEKRQREFIAGRTLARQALVELDVAPQAIPAGPKREPIWPSGIVGSITHCDDYVAAAVAAQSSILSLGIDAEPNLPLPDGIITSISVASEREQFAAMPHLNGDRLLFSIKECVYKTWFPLTKLWLGFTDVVISLDSTDSEAGGFDATFTIEPPAALTSILRRMRGRYCREGATLLTSLLIYRH